MQRLHAGHGEHDELDEACLELFDQALGDVGIDRHVATSISAYFRRATQRMTAYADSADQVPNGLRFNHA